MSQTGKKNLVITSIALYFTYFIHGIGASIMGQYKPELAAHWGTKALSDGTMDVSMVVSVIAALGLGRLISLPFSGPLSDKFGRRLSGIIGVICYAAYFMGIAFAPSMGVAYAFAIVGGIANSFLDTGIYPAVSEIIYKAPGVATMGIKFFIAIAQMMLPFVLGVTVATTAAGLTSYNMLFYVCGIAYIVLLVLVMIFPLPDADQKAAGKKEGLIDSLKHTHFSVESVAMILIGFTCTGTFQLWLNCAQTFGTEIAKIPSQNVSVMQTYYSAGTMVALFVTSVLITKFKQVRFLVIYPAISLVMLALVYMIKTPMICYVGAFVIGYAAAGGVLQMATAVVNDLFPKIKGTITSLVMIASSLCNYTILTAAAKMTSTSVIMMNIVITAIGILLALFVNVRYGVLLKNAEEASKN